MLHLVAALAALASVTYLARTYALRDRSGERARGRASPGAILVAGVLSLLVLTADPHWIVVALLGAGWLWVVSTFLGKPRAASSGNVAFDEWRRAEEERLRDTAMDFDRYLQEERAREDEAVMDSFSRERDRNLSPWRQIRGRRSSA